MWVYACGQSSLGGRVAFKVVSGNFEPVLLRGGGIRKRLNLVSFYTQFLDSRSQSRTLGRKLPPLCQSSLSLATVSESGRSFVFQQMCSCSLSGVPDRGLLKLAVAIHDRESELVPLGSRMQKKTVVSVVQSLFLPDVLGLKLESMFEIEFYNDSNISFDLKKGMLDTDQVPTKEFIGFQKNSSVLDSLKQRFLELCKPSPNGCLEMSAILPQIYDFLARNEVSDSVKHFVLDEGVQKFSDKDLETLLKYGAFWSSFPSLLVLDIVQNLPDNFEDWVDVTNRHFPMVII